MDKMKYHYNAGNNQLNYVYDTVPAGNYSVDIDAQSANNYQYDAIGNLIKDVSEGITGITWNVYGKISSITKSSGTITYSYDATGNRITKTVGGVTTLYVRDASGNVMSVYEIPSINNIVQKELHIYGSSRLGMVTGELDIEEVSLPSEFGEGKIVSVTRGKKYFELSNHLGNVMAVVSDKRISVAGGVYEADIVSATDYAPFGMGLVGREFNFDNAYRYSINGQEKTPEIAPNTTTAEYWQYDARIGRRWNVDPKPNIPLSSYSSFGNNPLYFTDHLGDTTRYFNIKDGSPIGIINNPGELRNVKIDLDRYTKATVHATSDPNHKFFGYLTNPSKAQGLVNEMEFEAKLSEIMEGKSVDYISFETGNFQLDFSGSILTSYEMTGEKLGKNHSESGIMGTMSLNSIFDDGSLLTVNTFNFTSGPYGNGPTPNNNYIVSFGNGYSNGLPVWNSSTSESGMLLNSGQNGWKLRLPNFNGRSGLLIHPDCNSIGTAGCIGIRENDRSLIKLRTFFENYIITQRRSLQVNFQIPNNPNYGNNGRANSNINQ